jgi:putative oxygen-independent coproporphyrinogen III oxidase
MNAQSAIDVGAERVGVTDKAAIPRALYIHLPWCVRKCPYCDFNSHEIGTSLPEVAYRTALVRDLDYATEHGWADTSFASVFFGGGTPSLFSAKSISTILSTVVADDGAEVSLEANPGTAEAQRFIDYVTAGVNRLSIGVQSFRDDKLKLLGRIHDADEASLAVDMALAAGFDSVNIDLMYGLPGDTVSGSITDLQRAIDCGVQHISWYQLTIEPGTGYAHKPPNLPSEEVIEEIELKGRLLLSASGFQRYEVSAYAKSADYRAAHNLNYWQFGDYLGVGAGGHSKLTLADRIVRESRILSPQRYMKLAGGDDALERVDIPRNDQHDQIIFEFLMNGLRLIDGFDLEMFEARTGIGRTVLREALARSFQAGALEEVGQRLRPTEFGLRYLNDVLATQITAVLSGT